MLLVKWEFVPLFLDAVQFVARAWYEASTSARGRRRSQQDTTIEVHGARTAGDQTEAGMSKRAPQADRAARAPHAAAWYGRVIAAAPLGSCGRSSAADVRGEV